MLADRGQGRRILMVDQAFESPNLCLEACGGLEEQPAAVGAARTTRFTRMRPGPRPGSFVRYSNACLIACSYTPWGGRFSGAVKARAT
jgi:hypothetical protein